MEQKFANYPFTVYDEHTPSVLELLGKIHGRVTILGNEFNQLDKVEAIRKGYATVWPSGDQTGGEDALAIQTAMDTVGTVHLVAGDYYLSKSIKLRTGNQLVGVGLDTKVHVVSLVNGIEGHSSGFDHIQVRDLYLINDYQGGGLSGISLDGNDKEPYNGARYSLLDGIRISGFPQGVVMRGAWSTVLRRIRTMNGTYGLIGLGCLNNITVDSCEFTHGSTGITLTCSGSTEMYGIRINDTNLEGNKVGLHAEGVTNLCLSNVYSENTPQIFSVNSCPLFTIQGGRVSGVNLLGTVTSTAYTSAKFANPKCHIEGLCIEANTTRTDLLYIDGGVTNSVVRNNRIINTGTGTVAMLSSFNGVEHRLTSKLTPGLSLRYSEDFTEEYVPVMASNERAMINQATLTLTGSVTISSAVSYALRLDEGNGTRTIATSATLTAGTHQSGKKLTFTFSEKPFISGPFILYLYPSVDVGKTVPARIQVNYQVADPGLQE